MGPAPVVAAIEVFTLILPVFLFTSKLERLLLAVFVAKAYLPLLVITTQQAAL